MDIQLECTNTIFPILVPILSLAGLKARYSGLRVYIQEERSSIELLKLVVTVHMTIFDTETGNDFWKTWEENMFLKER